MIRTVIRWVWRAVVAAAWLVVYGALFWLAPARQAVALGGPWYVGPLCVHGAVVLGVLLLALPLLLWRVRGHR